MSVWHWIVGVPLVIALLLKLVAVIWLARKASASTTSKEPE